MEQSWWQTEVRSESDHLTIGCTATDFPPLRGSKPAREPGVKCHEEQKIRAGVRHGLSPET